MRCPFATWRGDGLPNETPKGMLAHKGLVLHVQQGQEAGTDSWFHNPAAQASAHFGVGTDGHLDQWVDTDDKAWAEAGGNPYWVSVEIAGYSGQPATAAQVATLGALWAWLRGAYGWPNQATDDPNGTGLGWHGMGRQAWGGHLDCPGEPIKAQRAQILTAVPASQAPHGVSDLLEVIVSLAQSDDDAHDGFVRLVYALFCNREPTPTEWGAGKTTIAQKGLGPFMASVIDGPAAPVLAARRAAQGE